MAPKDELVAQLARDFPPGFVSTEAADCEEYGRDWTRVVAPRPRAVAFPKSTAEVSRLLRLCNQAGVGVVPSGGRTGLAGGAMAAQGEIVLSLSKMRRIGEVDPSGATVRVEAGAVTEAVHRHCEPHGLTWPVDFASKGSSTIGGNIATNAGGVKVIRYGLTRQWVLGLEVVLASGEILRSPDALEKNNTGLDLRQVFIGSEGTLGVVTEATLKLTRLPGPQQVMLFAVPDVQGVLRLFRAARRAAFTLSAYEFFTDRCLARVASHRKVRSPFGAPSPCYVLLEVEGPPETYEPWAEHVLADALATDATLAQHGGEAAALWTLREGISESLSSTGLPHKNDVSLPVRALEAFVSEFEQLFAARYPGWEICLFGHVGDGNLHINVMKPESMSREAFFAATKEADGALFALVAKHGGSISAEHGIGLLKKPFLSYTRSDAEILAMRAIKTALDPRGILNPGKIFD